MSPTVMKLVCVILLQFYLLPFSICSNQIRHKYIPSSSRRHVRRGMDANYGVNRLPQVSYEAQNNTEIVAQLGGSAMLKCYTENLGDEMVTWLKRDDEQLLTAGPQVYSSGNRYSVAHVKYQKLWQLSIRGVRQSDAGTYECQLTTHPPVSILFYLKVVEARAMIKGPKELHVHEGSKLKLKCHINGATDPPLYIFWFHNDSMVNYVKNRPLQVTKQHFGSSLIITNVTRSDAGSFKCEPDNAKTDNITLHVIAGENSAAMQKGRNDDGRKEIREENASLASQLPSSASASKQINRSLCIILLLLYSFGVSIQSSVNILIGRGASSPKGEFNWVYNLSWRRVSLIRYVANTLLPLVGRYACACVLVIVSYVAIPLAAHCILSANSTRIYLL